MNCHPLSPSLHPGWGSLGTKLCHTNGTLPSGVPHCLPGHSGSLVAKNQRNRHNPRTSWHIPGSEVLTQQALRPLGWKLGTSWLGEPAGATAGIQGWGKTGGEIKLGLWVGMQLCGLVQDSGFPKSSGCSQTGPHAAPPLRLTSRVTLSKSPAFSMGL